MNNQYPEWLLLHKDEKPTVGEWLKIIAEYYASDLNPESQGRPSKLSKDIALKLFYEYANTGYMVYALDSVGLDRSTELRWRKLNPAIRDMHILVKAFLTQAKTQKPAYWAFHHRQQMRVMQRKKGMFSLPTRNSWGRPSLFKSEYCQSVETTIESTAKACKVSKQTIISWSKEYPEFKSSLLLKRLERVAPLYEKRADTLEKQIQKALNIYGYDFQEDC
jgi:hypothetical protein